MAGRWVRGEPESSKSGVHISHALATAFVIQIRRAAVRAHRTGRWEKPGFLSSLLATRSSRQVVIEHMNEQRGKQMIEWAWNQACWKPTKQCQAKPPCKQASCTQSSSHIFRITEPKLLQMLITSYGHYLAASTRARRLHLRLCI